MKSRSLKNLCFNLFVVVQLASSAQCTKPLNISLVVAPTNSFCAPGTITLYPNVNNAAADGTVILKVFDGQGLASYQYNVGGAVSSVLTFSTPGVFNAYMTVTVVAASSTCTAAKSISIYVFDPSDPFCTKVGVEDVSAPLQISLFPNPTASHFLIQGVNYVEGTEVELFNLNGEKVCEWKNNKDEVYVIPENLRSGVYFFRVFFPNQKPYTEKLILQK